MRFRRFRRKSFPRRRQVEPKYWYRDCVEIAYSVVDTGYNGFDCDSSLIASINEIFNPAALLPEGGLFSSNDVVVDKIKWPTVTHIFVAGPAVHNAVLWAVMVKCETNTLSTLSGTTYGSITGTAAVPGMDVLDIRIWGLGTQSVGGTGAPAALQGGLMQSDRDPHRGQPYEINVKRRLKIDESIAILTGVYPISGDTMQPTIEAIFPSLAIHWSILWHKAPR